MGRNVFLQFHRELAAKILEHHGTLTSTTRKRKSVGNLDQISAPSFMELHSLDHLPLI